MKKVLRALAGVLIALILVAGAGAAWTVLSPMPVVYLLRHGFGEEEQPKYPEGYQERAARVSVERDATYPSSAGRNTYDVYLPSAAAHAGANGKKGPARRASAADSRRVPVIVWLHGGAFVAGDKAGLETWATMLASEGYAVVAVNYEWAPEVSYPGQVRQAQECLAALKDRAVRDLPLDMNRVVIAGDSAGAHIAAQVALLASNPEYGREIGVTSQLRAQDLDAALLMCGPYDVAKIAEVDNGALQFIVQRLGWAFFGDRDWQAGEMVATTTIKDYVTDAFPPSFITDGNNVSFEREGRELAEELAGRGVRVDTLFFDPAADGQVNHEYQMDLTSPQGERAYRMALGLLQDKVPVR